MQTPHSPLRWWPLALVPVAVSLMFAGYCGTRDGAALDWRLPISGVAVGVLVLAASVGWELWARTRGEADTHIRPMHLLESPVIWVPPIVLVAIVLTFVFNQQ